MTTQGSDVVLVFDVSASMDARDVPPTRLEEAKREALSLLESLEGDRVGVVAFAGDAVALTPLTLDLSAVRLLVETLSTDVVSSPARTWARAETRCASCPRARPANRRSSSSPTARISRAA